MILLQFHAHGTFPALLVKGEKFEVCAVLGAFKISWQKKHRVKAGLVALVVGDDLLRKWYARGSSNLELYRVKAVLRHLNYTHIRNCIYSA